MKKGKRRMTTDEYKKIVSASVSEEAEQIHLMQWCTWAQSKYPELEAIYHVPNEGKRSAVTGGKLRQMGLRSGVPDICLPVPSGEFIGLYIELKKVGGRLTDNQAVWLEMLERYGHCVAVCYGAEDAETVITAYLEQDIGTLDRHTLKRSRGDFKELKKRRRSSSKALSDLDAYQKAVKFYFPTATISFSMTINTEGNNALSEASSGTSTEKSEEKSSVNMSLDDLLGL